MGNTGPGAVAANSISLDAEFGHARALIQSGKSVIGSMFGDVRMGRALEVSGALLLVDSASQSLSRHSQALIALARLKARDDYSYMHAFAVCALMVAVGRTLELPPEEVRDLGLAGLLHDIGKLTLPEAVLHKPTSRRPGEDEEIRRHPSAGYRILNEARLDSNIVLDVCVHHHERVDGRGYPFGLIGREQSVHAKIAAICDTYDSLTSSRPGHQEWSPARAWSTWPCASTRCSTVACSRPLREPWAFIRSARCCGCDRTGLPWCVPSMSPNHCARA